MRRIFKASTARLQQRIIVLETERQEMDQVSGNLEPLCVSTVSRLSKLGLRLAKVDSKEISHGR